MKITYKNNTNRLKILFTSLILACSSSSLAVDTDEINKFSDFSDEHLTIEQIRKHPHMVLSELMQAKKNIQSQLNQNNDLESEHLRYIHQYAILNAVFAEYLLKQHCPELSRPFQNTAEQNYLRLNAITPNDRYLRYNLAIYYARMSMYFRKNPEPNPRYELLEKAEKLQQELFFEFPNEPTYKQDYYAVLSDKLGILIQKDQNIKEQQRIINILKMPLFEILDHPNQNYDSGNFIILTQHYFRTLYRQDPKQAEQWLKSNQNKIENFVLHYQNTSSQNEYEIQRENEFLAEFYALLNLPDQALHHLKQIDPESEDAPTPKTLEKEINLSNIRLNPKFQLWFKQYTQQYEAQVSISPQQCNIPNIEALKD